MTVLHFRFVAVMASFALHITIAMCLPANVGTTAVRQKRNYPIQALIGQTQRTELNWMVSIQYPREGDGKLDHICGGSLIADRLILTAAHCLYHRDSTQLLNETFIRIRIGSNNRFAGPSGDNTFKINYQAKLKEFNNRERSTWLQHDIAVLRLTTKVPVRPEIGFVQLPFTEELYFHTANSIFVAGWGYTERLTEENQHTRRAAEWLQKVSVQIIPNRVCQSLFDEFTVTQNMICTNSTINDVCQGDSGGALYEEYFDHLTRKNQQRIIGIISGSSEGCGAVGGASVHTRVFRYVKTMIYKLIQQCLRSETCD